MEQKKLNVTIPVAGDLSCRVEITSGEPLFVVGANGTGKSNLMHSIYKHFPEISHRISAHRQTWFSSGATLLSPPKRNRDAGNIMNADMHPDARWKDSYAEGRANIAIYDLLDAENIRARTITFEVDQGNMQSAKELAKKRSPLAAINSLFQVSQMPLLLSARGSERILVSKNGSELYSIAELSDGERNALLLAADIMTAKAGTLFLIDEPERHLHRSIISPLLAQLFLQRMDCFFVVSTHDVQLCYDHPNAPILLVRGCTYSGKDVKYWNIDSISSAFEIEASVKLDILGARRSILFVEGTNNSLDKRLYALLFPDCSVVPKTSCRDVVNAVRGIRSASDIHWVSAWGIIDNDGRSEADIQELKLNGIFALNCHSVESLYYHPEIIAKIAKRHAGVTGSDPHRVTSDAIEDALSVIRESVDHLANRMVERLARNMIAEQFPTYRDIQRGDTIQIHVDVPSMKLKVQNELKALLESPDYGALVARIPIRETGALKVIAKRLGFDGPRTYEEAARKLVSDEQGVREILYGLLGGIKEAIDNSDVAVAPNLE